MKKVSGVFETNDGQLFRDRSGAQQHEIEMLVNQSGIPDNPVSKHSEIAAFIINQKDALLAILSTRKPRVAKSKVGRPRKTVTQIPLQPAVV